MLTSYVNTFEKTKSFIKTDIQIELPDGLKAQIFSNFIGNTLQK